MDLGSVIQSPNLWLGNDAFTAFVGDVIFRLKEVEPHSDISILEESINWDLNLPATDMDSDKDNILKNIHIALCKYLCSHDSFNDTLIEIIDGDRENWTGVILDTFLMYQEHPKQQFRLLLMEALAPLLSGEFFVEMMKKIHETYRIDNPAKAFSFNISRTNDDHYRGLIEYLKNAHANIRSLDKEE